MSMESVMSDVLKGLTVTVYRAVDFPDCTNGGVTGRVSRAVLVDREGEPKTLPEIFEPGPDAPALVLMRDKVHLAGYIYAVPLDIVKSGKYPMFGGNFVHTSDSRLREAGCNGPVPVHDRLE
jgi:hypothetical protein